MNQQIQFRSGHVQVFVATRSFALGSSGITVPKGAEVEFDGTSVSYAGMAPIMMPQLRGALRTGWLVPSNRYDPDAPEERPQPAGMTMRAADGGNPMDPAPRRPVNMDIDHEEREVGNVNDHAAATRQRNQDNYRRQRTARSESTAGQRYLGVSVEPQDGVPVPGIEFQTIAGERAKRSSVDTMKAGAVISQAQKVRVRPGVGRTREELLEEARRNGATDEELMEYEMELAAARATKPVDAEPQRQVVGRVRAPQARTTEGFQLTPEVGGGTEIADLGGTGGQNRTEVIEEGGIRFTTTNGPRRGVRLVDKNAQAQEAQEAPPPAPATRNVDAADDAVCRTIAVAICPDFPDNYRFGDPIRKKIARLQADYDDRPDVIRAVAAAETDGEVKRRLIEEFPEAFER